MEVLNAFRPVVYSHAFITDEFDFNEAIDRKFWDSDDHTCVQDLCEIFLKEQ